MTNSQRTLVTLVVLLSALVLATAGVVTDQSGAPAYIGGFGTLTGTVLGYTFGRTNGEKALAGAIVTAAANTTPAAAVQQAIAAVTPGQTPSAPGFPTGELP